MRKRCLVVLAILLGGAAAGCRGTAPPNWFHPGPAEYQQSQAQQFDPYPEIDSGPTVLGARPLEYDKPPAEVLRVQPQRNQPGAAWLPWNWGRR